MRKKILFGSIFVLALILLMPSITAVKQYNKVEKEDTIEFSDLIGRCIVRGFGILPFFHGENVTFLTIRCHYTVFTATEMDVGVIRFRWVTLPKDSVHIGIFNFFVYFIGFLQGGMTIEQFLFGE